MSVVIGFSFPDEAILISDSRISFVKNKVVTDADDVLQKIFPLTSQLAVGFTSNDVDLTHKILVKLESYIKKEAKSTFTYSLLKKLPKVASFEYSRLTKTSNKPPMEFIYAGILPDRMLRVPEKYVIDLLTRNGGGEVPENIGKAFMTMKDGHMYIDPPTPVVMKQSFPSQEVSDMRAHGFLVSGSGSPIENVFAKEYYHCVTTASVGGFRGNVIRLYCDEFIKSAGIATIGGGVQVLSISTKGTKPISMVLKGIDNNSNTWDISSMSYDGKNWSYKNHKTGEEKVIKSFKDLMEQYTKKSFSQY